MAKQNTKAKRGFTLIEVVLVLAIAGLILIMALVVWPRVQTTVRDRQRTQDYDLLATSISNYYGSKLSNVMNADLNPETLINKDGTDPDGNKYDIKTADCDGAGGCDVKPEISQVYVVIHADCTGGADEGLEKPAKNTSNRAFAIYGYLEGGSQTYCVDSK